MENGNSVNSYLTHDEDENVIRRAFNRCATAHNIFENHGPKMCKEYLENFTGQDRKEFMLMAFAIKSKGLEEVKREVLKKSNS